MSSKEFTSEHSSDQIKTQPTPTTGQPFTVAGEKANYQRGVAPQKRRARACLSSIQHPTAWRSGRRGGTRGRERRCAEEGRRLQRTLAGQTARSARLGRGREAGARREGFREASQIQVLSNPPGAAPLRRRPEVSGLNSARVRAGGARPTQTQSLRFAAPRHDLRLGEPLGIASLGRPADFSRGAPPVSEASPLPRSLACGDTERHFFNEIG